MKYGITYKKKKKKKNKKKKKKKKKKKRKNSYNKLIKNFIEYIIDVIIR